MGGNVQRPSQPTGSHQVLAQQTLLEPPSFAAIITGAITCLDVHSLNWERHASVLSLSPSISFTAAPTRT